MNVPASLTGALASRGHVAAHARQLRLSRASDEEIVELARERGETIITNDLDFARILAVDGVTQPSLIIFRVGNAHPAQLQHLLETHLDRVVGDLARGAIVVIEPSAVRIRLLPVGTNAERVPTL
jgi:predicted nuclease of predicted toxin-antitoxin system